MHNRIYQISTEPIQKDAYISEEDFYEHPFVGEVADYVSDNCDRVSDINALGGVKGCVVSSDENGEFLQVMNKEEYFSRAYTRFKGVLDNIKDCTLAQFAEGLDNMWEFKNAYDKKFDAYFYFEEEGIDSFDAFVRRATIGTKYYIGGTLDYHY